MKFRFVMNLVCVALMTVSLSEEAGGTIKVFLLAGQSNMAGHGDADDLTGALAGYLSPQADVNIWRSFQDEGNAVGSTNGWIPLAPEFGDFYNLRNSPTFGGREPSFGPEVSFGKAVAVALPDDEIYLIKHAWGATSLAGGWDPVAGTSSGVMTGSNTTPGLQYNLFTSTVASALTNLDNAGLSYEIAGMLWLQGESDAINASTDNAYEANLTAFIAQTRTNYGDDLPFIIARINPQWGGADSETRAAQQSVAEATEGVYWFDTDNFSRPSGNVHYDTQGQIEIGQAFADTYLNQVVPEPGMASLFGLCGLLLLRRR